MALTAITWSPTSVINQRGSGQPETRSVTASGNESFTGGTLSEPNGASGWLTFPTTCDHGVAFNLKFAFAASQLTSPASTTLRVTKNAVTADLVVTVNPAPHYRGSRGGGV